MTARSYKLIFALLSCCVLVIICLQGYWIRNFYLQKKEEFDRNVYASLEELNTKLQDRKNLQSLKMTYFIQNGDTIAKTPSHKMTVISAGNVQIIKSTNANVKPNLALYDVSMVKKKWKKKDSVQIKEDRKQFNIQLDGTSAHVEANTKGKTITDIIKESTKVLADTGEIKDLVDKMVNEIKIIDLDEEGPDTLQAMIKKTLINKGIFLPFEFSKQNLKNEKSILAQSKGFSDSLKTYKRDLSSKRVIYTGDFLFLQFPTRDSFLMANMKSSLLLSALFSLAIMAAFYYVIRIILSQKKLSEMKTDFVNNMTHELKTPIATISLAMDAITNPLIKNDEEKFKEYIRILKEENKKLDTHVERVLQIALLDRGELRLAKRSLEVKPLLESVLKIYKLQLEQNAEVSLDVPEGLRIYADEGHIKTVFANLLDNALKYSKEKCHIEIWAKKEGQHVSIHISDNGIGIDADQQKRIFEKFYRVQGGNLHDVKGFGLGLSYVKSIVEAHGGQIEVKSRIGQGSEFIIYFNHEGV